MLNASTIATHFDRFFRAVATDQADTPAPGFFRLITGQPHPLGNLGIIDTQVSPDTLAAHLDPLCSPTLPTAVLLMDEHRPEQAAPLLARGFAFAESMPLMSVTPNQLAPTTLPPGYDFTEVHPHTPDAAAWCEAMCLGYGLPPALGDLFSPERCAAALPGTTHHFAITHQGRMVATSLLNTDQNLGGIYAVATLPEHRGKGLAAHATAEAARHAWQQGLTHALLQASAMGAPVYTRLGFHTHATMPLYARMPQ